MTGKILPLTAKRAFACTQMRIAHCLIESFYSDDLSLCCSSLDSHLSINLGLLQLKEPQVGAQAHACAPPPWRSPT
jgi:hypothetical protein